MSVRKISLVQGGSCAPLSVEQLEVGLRVLDDRRSDLDLFWEQNIDAFRHTVIFAIRETSDALLSPMIPLGWRVELESQLEDLVRYIELADRYIARRSVSSKRAVLALAPARSQIH